MIHWLLRGVRRLLGWALLIGLMLALLQYSSYPTGIPWNAVALLVGDSTFDYVGWEVRALALKLDQTLYGAQPFLSESQRVQIVRSYMADLQTAQSLEARIDALYADPAWAADSDSAALRRERDQRRAELRGRQTLVESILEGQVAAVLVEQGFGLLGQVLPPVSAHFTQVPALLVVSPRDQIRFDISINLDPLPVEAQAALEDRIDAQQDLSSLVVPLGGIALYPAMVLETASIPYALDTIAHEWLHHYLFFFPLGLEYFSGEGFAGETRILNETTAALFGQEMSRLVLARYYPDLLPPPPPPPAPPAQDAAPPAPPAFDFGAEMDATRRRVDALLAAGDVAAAEQFMRDQREVFVANGYRIRKLNQAFFAFYGGYQAGGTAGAAGADPIGPALRALRQRAGSLHDWIVQVRGLTRRDQLLALEAQAVPALPQ